MTIVFYLDNGDTLKINKSNLREAIVKDESRIYLYDEYLIKVFPLNDFTINIPEKIKILKSKIKNSNQFG